MMGYIVSTTTDVIRCKAFHIFADGRVSLGRHRDRGTKIETHKYIHTNTQTERDKSRLHFQQLPFPPTQFCWFIALSLQSKKLGDRFDECIRTIQVAWMSTGNLHEFSLGRFLNPFRYTPAHDVLVAVHCQNVNLACQLVLHQGPWYLVQSGRCHRNPMGQNRLYRCQRPTRRILLGQPRCHSLSRSRRCD